MKLLKRQSRRRARRLASSLVPLLPSFLRLLGGLIMDRRVSLADKGLLLGVVVYILSPLDLVPDFLGVLGWVDDLYLLALAVRRLVRGAGGNVVKANWPGTGAGLRRLMGALEDLGELVPGPVRGILGSVGRGSG